MTEMYRQGDLLFIKTNKTIGTAIKSKDILKSSITGHSHSITNGTIYVNDDINWEHKGNFYLYIPDEGTEIIHPEHKSIFLSAGIYEVRRQREVNGYVQD